MSSQAQTASPQYFIATPEAELASTTYLLTTLTKARAAMPPAEFRSELRTALLDRPGLTLQQVASALGVSRQRASQMVGRLDRPTSIHADRPAPRREEARRRLAELTSRVAAGEPADHACAQMGISQRMARKLGFRARVVRPVHGTEARLQTGCGCWRCRRAGGLARPRGRKMDPVRQQTALDWLAWRDPDTGEGLTQVQVGRLAGVGQGAVSRMARAVAAVPK